MTQRGPIQWRSGAGWLVLAGGGEWQEGETGEIDAAALGWSDLHRPVAVLPTAGTSTAEGEALLDYYAELGGPSGCLVPILDASSAHEAENYQLLRESGLIYIADGPDPVGLVRILRQSPALEAIALAFEEGATVLGVGAGAAALGAWIAADSAEQDGERGWGWLPHVVVAPHFTGAKSTGRLRSLLDAHPQCLGLGVPDGVALGLGPTGRVVTLGEGQATVVLGGVKGDTLPEAAE